MRAAMELMKIAPLAAALVGTVALDAMQPGRLLDLHAMQRLAFPRAVAFSAKEGDLPHYKAFIDDNRTLGGLVFWTTDLEPLERGYDGPIKILVGIDTGGLLTGIVVADHHEPYGSFSVDEPRFAAQFKGKSIRDPFRVGSDIYAVSRATMTITSATRAVRNGARRLARQLLTPPAAR
jgi:NosR/NirI family nitrous oxide reductase transcriptional regulator